MQSRWCSALILALLGCSFRQRDTPAPPSSTNAGASPEAAVASAVAAPPRPSPRRSDPRWLRAQGDDPAQLQRLAIEVGAAELVDGVNDGGDIAAVALGALPYADDADIALAPLAELASAPTPSPRQAILTAILAVAGRPRRARELLDPEGVRRAGEVMLSLAARQDVPRAERALAISAARALAEKGYVDASRVPADLDPR
jgi:hypothetical protein